MDEHILRFNPRWLSSCNPESDDIRDFARDAGIENYDTKSNSELCELMRLDFIEYYNRDRPECNNETTLLGYAVEDTPGAELINIGGNCITLTEYLALRTPRNPYTRAPFTDEEIASATRKLEERKEVHLPKPEEERESPEREDNGLIFHEESGIYFSLDDFQERDYIANNLRENETITQPIEFALYRDSTDRRVRYIGGIITDSVYYSHTFDTVLFDNTSLTNVKLPYVTMRRCTFIDTNLVASDMTNFSVEDSNFLSVNLSTPLTNGRFNNCTFDDVRGNPMMRDVTFRFGDIRFNFNRATLSEIRFQCRLHHSSFSDCSLQIVSIHRVERCIFDGCTLDRILLHNRQSAFLHTDFSGCTLTSLSRQHFSRCKITDCDMGDFSNSELYKCLVGSDSQVNFESSKFTRSELNGYWNGCNLKKAFMKGCNVDLQLEEASMTQFKAKETSFDDCSFERADLSFAYFEDCIFKDCTFDGAQMDSVTFRRCEFSDTTFEGSINIDL